MVTRHLVLARLQVPAHTHGLGAAAMELGAAAMGLKTARRFLRWVWWAASQLKASRIFVRMRDGFFFGGEWGASASVLGLRSVLDLRSEAVLAVPRRGLLLERDLWDVRV